MFISRTVHPQLGSAQQTQHAKVQRDPKHFAFASQIVPQWAPEGGFEHSLVNQTNGSEDKTDKSVTTSAWKLERVAHALSRDAWQHARKDIKQSIQSIPYHGLWAGAKQFKADQAVIYGQIGQDLVRSLNGALGQYNTAEQLGKSLKQAYVTTCLIMKTAGLPLTILSQEYNMVFLRAPKRPNAAQAAMLQRVLAEQVWQQVHAFFSHQAKTTPSRAAAIEEVRRSLRSHIPLMNIGICSDLKTNHLSHVEQLAHCAIGASAAAKLARAEPKGFVFANAQSVVDALQSYRSLLCEHQHLHTRQGAPLVARTPQGTLLLNPHVLAEFRAKKLDGVEQEVVGRAVALLNCLDWVQQSRFSELANHLDRAVEGRSLVRRWRGSKTRTHGPAIKAFCLAHVPYLALAEELTRNDGTLFWMDMKKLAVRCHIIREAEAMRLLAQADAGNKLAMEDIVEAMIAIDTRVQDARDVLPAAAQLADHYLQQQGIKATLRIHIGGDDAAMLIHVNGEALTPKLAADVGNHIAAHSDRLRVAHTPVHKGDNLAAEMCRIDRILAATKID
jgi:hypothetical protein